MARLTTAKKKGPGNEFGLPENRKYPMSDTNHPRKAKARPSEIEHRGE
jgi:hypothetical protein